MSTEPRPGGGPGDWPEGYGRVILEEVDSTLDEARRRHPTTAAPTWILARRQKAGRGRRGRAWIQPAGNFAATLLLPDAGPPAQAALRSFVAALAVADALAGLGVETRLKWPNDVLLDGGKLAGILLEGLPGGGLAVGIGVNLAAAPEPEAVEPGALAPVALTPARGVAVAPPDFLTLLARAWAAREASLARLGFAPIRTAWKARAARLGQEIRVRLPQETLSGIFKDVDAAGQLVLSTGSGLRRIAAGEVFLEGGQDASGD